LVALEVGHGTRGRHCMQPNNELQSSAHLLVHLGSHGVGQKQAL
jgi:hypothetical protein